MSEKDVHNRINGDPINRFLLHVQQKIHVIHSWGSKHFLVIYHTHTHTHTHTHAHAHAHACTCICTHMRIHTHTILPHTHTHTLSNIYRFKNIYIYSYIDKRYINY